MHLFTTTRCYLYRVVVIVCADRFSRLKTVEPTHLLYHNRNATEHINIDDILNCHCFTTGKHIVYRFRKKEKIRKIYRRSMKHKCEFHR